MKQKNNNTREEFESKWLNKKYIKVNSNQKAAFTHYLHNYSNGVASLFKEDAFIYAKDILINEFPEKDITEKVVEKEIPSLIKQFNKDLPFPTPSSPSFKFIDLFAGIGGFRLALQNLNGKCIFTSEWDEYAKKTYAANFGEIPFGDITKDSTKNYIPSGFDVLCAGFPCQAFSIAGQRGGFNDTRGTLFFDVAEIIKKHQPKAIFLENVKGLRNHDKGKTLSTILNVLRNDLNYFVPEPQIINAKDFGVPQNRERIFIVGFRNDLGINDFQYPKPSNPNTKILDILEEDEVSVKYYLSTTYLDTLRKHKARHASKGNGFGYEIKEMEGKATAIVCGGMGRERNLLIDDRLTNFTPVTKIKGEVNREGIRKMTPREWARLQGYPDNFKIKVSDVQAYKQLGNSVAVPAIQATAEKIIECLYNNH